MFCFWVGIRSWSVSYVVCFWHIILCSRTYVARMSYDASWDIESCRDEHESGEHWALRREFLQHWKGKYPKDRLLCLARVFTNIELMGCRYPADVMMEVAELSKEVAKSYRSNKKNMLQRTFVSASDAAEDRAKGIKRKAGVTDTIPKRINFVAQGKSTDDLVEIEDDNDSRTICNSRNGNQQINFVAQSTDKPIEIDSGDDDKIDLHTKIATQRCENVEEISDNSSQIVEVDKPKINVEIIDHGYFKEFQSIACLNLRHFRESMFHTSFGRMVLMVRSWISRLNNVHASVASCGLQINNTFINNTMTISINGKLLASATGGSKAEARSNIEMIAWNRLRSECVILLVKEQIISRDSERIGGDSVHSHVADRGLATPVDSSVAAKMMKLMGWTGGGLGANEEGISEPIKPHLQQVHRAGLGSKSELSSLQNLKRRAGDMMRRYAADQNLEYDLVFSADFSKEERAELHQVAQRCGLNSKSYGTGDDRFLVVRKKMDPFAIARAIVQSGGETQKYQVFIPNALANKR